MKTIMASITYQLEENENSEPSKEIYFDQVTVRDIYGHRLVLLETQTIDRKRLI